MSKCSSDDETYYQEYLSSIPPPLKRLIDLVTAHLGDEIEAQLVQKEFGIKVKLSG